MSGPPARSVAFAVTLVCVDLAPGLLATFTYRFFPYCLPIAPALVVVPTAPELRSRLRAFAAERAAA